jgi:hypothetical protein
MPMTAPRAFDPGFSRFALQAKRNTGFLTLGDRSRRRRQLDQLPTGHGILVQVSWYFVSDVTPR